MIGRYIKRGVVEAGSDIGGVFEDEGWAAMLAERGRGGGVFDDRAIGRQVAAQDAQAAFGLQRLVQRADDVGVADFGVGDILRQRTAGHGEGVAVQQRQQRFQHGRDAAGVEEVFHLIFAGRAHIGDQGRAAADLVKAREP